MPFEAQSLEMPCEMKEKAFKTSREAFEGVLKEFAMPFEAHCLEILCGMKGKKHLKHSAQHFLVF